MSIKISHFLAWRYLKGTTEQPSLKIMIWICMLGIFIGTCALGLTTAIMNGFEKETHKKLQGIYPDLVIQAPHGTSLSEELIPYLHTTFPNEIIALAPASTHHVLIEKKDTNSVSIVGICKIIDPATESITTSLEEKINNHQKLSTLLTSNHIIIGKEIAHSLDAQEGDTLTISYNQHPESTHKDGSINEANVIVAGILTTGILDYDATLIIGSQQWMDSLLGRSFINQIGVKLNPLLSEKKKYAFIKTIKTIPELTISTWYDQYPAIVSALKLEKYAMLFLLALIAIVASMNSISLLFMFITHKRTEIALLQSLGLEIKYIMLIFVLLNTIIASIASLCGLCSAYLIGIFLQKYPFIHLPDAYFVTTLPVHITLHSMSIIFISSIALSILTSLLPLASIKKTSITTVLRFE